MRMPDPLTDRLLAAGPYHRQGAPHALVEVAGPDAGDFLQRLCTQDVLGLAEGAGAPAAFLSAKGRIEATVWVYRAGPTEFLLECQAAQAAKLLALLERFHFTEKLAFGRRFEGACREWVWRKPPAGWHAPVPGMVRLSQGIALVAQRLGVCWLRVHGSAAGLPVGSVFDSGRTLDEATADCLRMGAGLVAVGTDTDAGTLALEADLDDHCSTTKGCYTGQEVVARIHTYGHVNRKLALLHVHGGVPVTEPVQLVETEDGIAVGRVLHAVASPQAGLQVGLGYLPKDFWAVGTRLRLGSAEGAEVEVVGFEPVGTGPGA